MKHLRTLTLLTALTLLTTISLPASAQRFSLGFRDGVSLSWLAGIENTLPLAGFYVGVTADYMVSDNWAVGIDATLAEQGAQCLPNGDDVAMTYSFDYLNIPVLARYCLPFGSDQLLTLSAGAQVGLFLLCSYAYTAPSVLGDEMISGNGYLDSNSFHPMDFGIVAAVEYGMGDFSIEARYTLGITQTHNGISNTLNGYYYISVPDNRNSVFQLGTGYRF